LLFFWLKRFTLLFVVQNGGFGDIYDIELDLCCCVS